MRSLSFASPARKRASTASQLACNRSSKQQQQQLALKTTRQQPTMLIGDRCDVWLLLLLVLFQLWLPASAFNSDIVDIDDTDRAPRAELNAIRDNDDDDDCSQLDCSSELPLTRAHICASDGQLYESVCEMQLASCKSYAKTTTAAKHRTGAKLIRKADEFCATPRPSLAKSKVRFVKLTQKCNQLQYKEMKLKLLAESGNQDSSKLFDSFDTNGDNSIEAHELWPNKANFRAANGTTRANDNDDNEQQQDLLVYYDQIWRDHSTECNSEEQNAELADQPAPSDKCWYQLDFAFEPHSKPNPCSLSHLMLYDLPHPKRSFTRESFAKAFEGLETGVDDDDEPKQAAGGSLLHVRLGETVSLSCLNGSSQVDSRLEPKHCAWTRYNVNLALMQRDPHLSVEQTSLELASSGELVSDLTLTVSDAQLYLSGRYTCQCGLDTASVRLARAYMLHVVAEPRVTVEPAFVWSMAGSRATFSCRYDYIDSSPLESNSLAAEQQRQQQKTITTTSGVALATGQLEEGSLCPIVASGSGQFGLQLAWQTCASSKQNNNNNNSSLDSNWQLDSDNTQTVERYSSSMLASRLTIEQVQPEDSGSLACSVTVKDDANRTFASGQGLASLLVEPSDSTTRPSDVLVWDGPQLQQQQQQVQQGQARSTEKRLWMFHDNGISVYGLRPDDSQEMELIRELNGHSLLGGQVEGNWNQLTLCGGLNPDQVVICQWSDNAIHIEVDLASNSSSEGAIGAKQQQVKKYVYVGQPNLNRVVVLDGLNFEIVAVVNTEPQPRRLFLHKPDRVRLSRWIRRRLAPHPPNGGATSADTRRRRRRASSSGKAEDPAVQAKWLSKLVQYDIWLLCYGEPLELDSLDATSTTTARGKNASHLQSSGSHKVLPFTPRLLPLLGLDAAAASRSIARPRFGASGGGGAGWPMPISVWPGAAASKESRLRNRKSVHILQSTFFNPDELLETRQRRQATRRPRPAEAASYSPVAEFKRSTLITTQHMSPPGHLTAPMASSGSQPATNGLELSAGRPYDLIQDILVPERPGSLTGERKFKLRYAYATHYNERRLFRVAMDEHRYNREIDLENCDPIQVSQAVQGLLIVQCRSPISHNLIGQLVLDELTGSRVEFNANVRAQSAFISPDNRYIVNIFTNQTIVRGQQQQQQQQHLAPLTSTNSGQQQQHNKQLQSIVYVQLITVSGLKFQYKIKTSLEISQCAFVWRDSYYAAIFVSSNKRDLQSEVLSLRLADGRLELMARVPGLISSSNHKQHLLVSPETRLAVLSTSQGSFVIDLDDNRISQSLRHPQSPPTLLWV